MNQAFSWCRLYENLLAGYQLPDHARVSPLSIFNWLHWLVSAKLSRDVPRLLGRLTNYRAYPFAGIDREYESIYAPRHAPQLGRCSLLNVADSNIGLPRRICWSSVPLIRWTFAAGMSGTTSANTPNVFCRCVLSLVQPPSISASLRSFRSVARPVFDKCHQQPGCERRTGIRQCAERAIVGMFASNAINCFVKLFNALKWKTASKSCRFYNKRVSRYSVC